MSSSRSNLSSSRAYKPPLAAERVAARSPLTPRLAANASSTLSSRNASTTTSRVRQQTEEADNGGADNVTPRSAKRRSRVEGNTTPNLAADSPGIPRAQTVSPLALGGNSMLMDSSIMARPSVTRSPMSDSAAVRLQAPFVRSPMASEISTRVEDDLDSRFFHASEISKVEKPVKAEVKKPAAFFYADGQQEQNTTSPPVPRQDQRSIPSTRTTSPARSAVGRQRQSSEHPNGEPFTKSPPMLSPALSTVSSASPFFAAIATAKPRSPSPSKDNIHLSYRRGVSQIIGNRPSPIPSPRPPADTTERRPSFQRAFNAHRKSPSLSSIDSELTNRSRRRSNTAQDLQGSSPLREEPAFIEEAGSPTHDKPTLNTAIELAGDSAPMSPSKSISEMAADARRERKVLDLEISNSSLLAINSSLEREIRRQKSELKRFRRLSRAGRFSTDLQQDRRGSGSLGTLNEVEHDLDSADIDFGPPSGLSELYNDYSDSDEESSVGSSEPGVGDRKLDRLAKDDQRLRADLERHRELLVQSQMMNQSLRRCLYATEELIKAGKKAVDYKVRVSDVKLGGRILTGHEDEDEFGDPIEDIEVEDEFDDALSPASPMSNDGMQDHAQSFVEIWGGIGKDSTPVVGVEAADRDSGIDMDGMRAADLPSPSHTASIDATLSLHTQ